MSIVYYIKFKKIVIFIKCERSQNCSGVLRTPECGAELSLPTADLFGCALIRTPEQIRWSESRRGLQACSLSLPRLRSAPHYEPYTNFTIQIGAEL